MSGMTPTDMLPPVSPPVPAPPAHPHHVTSETARTEAFSDGVFAIVITLLILEIKVPPPSSIPVGAVAHELPHRLWELKAMFIAYVLSFFIVGTFWVAHHNVFKLIRRTNRLFMWINLALLMCVAFIPFPTALIGEYVDQPIAIVVYGLTVTASSVMLLCLWSYATGDHRLVDPELAPSLIKRVRGQMLLAPPVYLTAIVLAYVNIWLSFLVFAALQVHYMRPGQIDRHMQPAPSAGGGVA
jgi:TMEM175 potassium channel family protein